MPIYEYACDGCGHRFEQLQSITAEPVRVCPECRDEQVRRLISVSSFQLKGSGWYVTDYKGQHSGSAGHRSNSAGEGVTNSGETTAASNASPPAAAA